ncbi:hypothetical protein MLD38_008028 [Melastoma candidum]|uniref:Uncharacterized protein n=1 Tax=Melastoma candidum TaxID=119954 RepID=A0ACB9RUW9_9MYRT|nr:hypothetical protein MLD38_008028 [Melastoma candidum]
MRPPNQQSRDNLVELRALVVKRIGLERSELYFHYVNRFLGLKLGKAEFDKLCTKVLGKENLRLHNQLIRAILRNASCGKAPPVSPVTYGHKSLSNGDAQHLSSPRTSIAIPRHRNGIVKVSTSRPVDVDDRVICENGTLGAHDSVQHSQEPTRGISLSSKNQNRFQNSGYPAYGRSQMNAMLGLPFCAVGSADNSRKTILGESYYQCSGGAGLLDSRTLRDRMQHFASAQGLEAVSMECANLLNKGLDAYLRRLIHSCFAVTRAKHRDGLTVGGLHSHFFNQRTQLQDNGRPLDYRKSDRSPIWMTMLDYKVSMELNPQQLGENWPPQMEKLCDSLFDWHGS